MADLEFNLTVTYCMEIIRSLLHAFRVCYVAGTVGDAGSTKKDKIFSVHLRPCNLLEVRDKRKYLQEEYDGTT